MRVPTLTSSKIQSEITDIHGFLTVAVYIHYFLPGRLKIRTKLHRVKLGELGGLFYHPYLDSSTLVKTRRAEGERWLAVAEMPYPGYCRAPGSSQCLEVFCNCKALTKQWEKYVSKLKQEGEMPK